ncbi:30S ribosomal protein S10 [symbiont of Argiope bruennichi]|uniref:30S ribosomal protein S10 n=1 Tax=symbiont of Argiope bruennichi TaxID=2810479 RepID=UPI003DA4ABC7
MNQLRIKFSCYDFRVLDKTIFKIIEIFESKGIQINGPIPLPTKTELITVLRSPQRNKDSREQFHLRTHNRLLCIKGNNTVFLESIKNIVIPSQIQIKIIS